jgi:hypothetical protein
MLHKLADFDAEIEYLDQNDQAQLRPIDDPLPVSDSEEDLEQTVADSA